MHAILRPLFPSHLLRSTDSQAALSVIFSFKSTIVKKKLKRPLVGRYSQKAINRISPAFPV
jgi:hypothetical protein